MWCATDTIVAISSASGGGARGIVRISGPEAERCWRALVDVGATEHWATEHWATDAYATDAYATDAYATDAATRDTPGGIAPVGTSSGKSSGTSSGKSTVVSHGAWVARVIPGQLRLSSPWPALPCAVFWWPGRRSYTRQPTAELHVWGSPPLLDALLDEACRAGARLARPGEFTLRAFLAGRLDLTQAEAVLGVIDARGQRELDVALDQLAGGLAHPLRDLRARWLELLAHLEAGLDFVEEDIEFIDAREMEDELERSRAELRGLEQRLEGRGVAAGAPRVALVGLPNVGKSSLFNALADESISLVADIPGTTRDYLVRELEWEGRRLRLIDTAGWERDEGAHVIAVAAQRLAAAQREGAWLRLLCLDTTRSLDARERDWLAECDHLPTLVVLTKGDLENALPEREELVARGACVVSARTGAGLVALRHLIAGRIVVAEDAETAVVTGTAVRCRDSVHRARESLDRALDLCRSRGGEELLAVELRCALDELGQVIGAVYTDDILDVIFSRFCIGK